MWREIWEQIIILKINISKKARKSIRCCHFYALFLLKKFENIWKSIWKKVRRKKENIFSISILKPKVSRFYY